MTAPLVEGRDYTLENGKMVLTASFLLRRGFCCNCGCRNCPYRGDAAKRIASVRLVGVPGKRDGEP